MIYEPIPVPESEAILDIHELNLHDPIQQEALDKFIDGLRDTLTSDHIKYFSGQDALPSEFTALLRNEISRFVRVGNGNVFSFSVDEHIVGVCMVGSNRNKHQISTIVLPKFHSLGIASALKMYVLNYYIGSDSLDVINAEILFENIASLRTWQKVKALVKDRYYLDIKGGGRKGSKVNLSFRYNFSKDEL